MSDNQLYDKINKLDEKLMFIMNEVNNLKNKFEQIKCEFEKQNKQNKQNKQEKIKKMNEENTDNAEIKSICDNDLNLNQFDEKTLGLNIERGTITQYQVFRTQKNLSNEFIVEYILNEDYGKFTEDSDITINKIIGKFPNFAYFNPKTYNSKKS